MANPIRIVVAEDEAIIRLDLVETLHEEGYLVVADTGRGDTAIELVREHKPDVAIFDIKMPGLDGLAAARAVSDEKICPVVMLTAFSQREVIEQARDAGALAYLVKPFQKTDLVPAIELAIGRFAEMKLLSGERDALDEQLQLRKVLDRAKGVLIDSFSMTEQAAFDFIQKGAMATRSRMKDVAQRVIDGELTPNS
jgi:response regulator NasT